MISIVVPLYNKEKQVEATINSVLLQSYFDFEIVIIDDGSTDQSATIVLGIKDNRIHYYKKTNGGVSAARNYGINKAKGEWLVFLDADDLLLPGALVCFMQMLHTFPTSKVFVAAQRSGNPPVHASIQPKCTTHPFWHVWMRHIYPRPGVFMVHRDIVQERGGFDERMSFFEDYEFGLRMLGIGSIVYSGQNVLDYEPVDGGLSSKSMPIQCEMAYYTSELIVNNGFWHKMLLYENLMFTASRRVTENDQHFYEEIISMYFSAFHRFIFKLFNRIRNR